MYHSPSVHHETLDLIWGHFKPAERHFLFNTIFHRVKTADDVTLQGPRDKHTHTEQTPKITV